MRISHSADVTLAWPLTVQELQARMVEAIESGVPPTALVSVHGPHRRDSLSGSSERCRIAFAWETGREEENAE